ncbi:MAG TPA: hypothetical protein VFY28_00625 [Candidatus Paceibacterota bacterium]|nr:hypothetical protein [Candidatus Paceibacterota bacterium]
MDSLLAPITEAEVARLTGGDPRYEDLVIYDGLSWKLYLNEDQRYLGRAYVWLKSCHRDFHQLGDLNPDDLEELMRILRTYHATVRDLWNADTLNYGWLGNEYHMHRGHGHMHVVPRYAAPPEFGGREYPDERWGQDYKPYDKLKLPRNELLSITDELKERFIEYMP